MTAELVEKAFTNPSKTMPPRKFKPFARGGKSISIAPQKKTDPSRVVKPATNELPEGLCLTQGFSAIPTALYSSNFSAPQPFFSALERIFPELSVGSHGHDRCWMGIPDAAIRSFAQENPEEGFRWTLTTTENKELPVFLKRAHLLDPMDAMSGSYLTPREGGLPAPSIPWQAALKKLNDPMNEAYVDALFALYADKMVTSGISPHWCRCYGTYAARAETYMYDITEEYDSLKREPWWHKNQRANLFKVFNDEEDDPFHDIRTKEGDDLDVGDFDTLDDIGDVSVPTENVITLVSNEEPLGEDKNLVVKLTTPRIRFKKIEKTESDSDESDSSIEEGTHYAEFHDFPVQVTLLERADETLEDLSEEEFDDPKEQEECWTAWLFQIIAALSAAQHFFGFAHNDLHSNNVMWSKTDQEFLHYRIHKGKDSYIMRVPTYGKLMKIIDFGRASYTLPDPGGFFISDAFYPGNDAAEQYNCDPFYDPKEGPRLEPNPSFDLCRLAVSLLDSLFPNRPASVTPIKIMSREGGKIYSETVSPVYNLLWEWLQDDEGRNVLRNADGSERYPQFDLYCALAKEVHKAIPKRQIEKPLFARFRNNTPKEGAPVYNLYL